MLGLGLLYSVWRMITGPPGYKKTPLSKSPAAMTDKETVRALPAIIAGEMPHNMDYLPTRWPESHRTVVQCYPRASNGPDHSALPQNCARRSSPAPPAAVSPAGPHGCAPARVPLAPAERSGTGRGLEGK